MDRNLIALLLLGVSLVFAGCLSDVSAAICGIAPGKDGDHCLQAVGSTFGDEFSCDKIKGESFKQYGSNPPKDKCFLQVAEGKQDDSVCEKIKGGTMSYTPKQCLDAVAVKTGNVGLCNGDLMCYAKVKEGGNMKPFLNRNLSNSETDQLVSFVKGQAYVKPLGEDKWYTLGADAKLKAGDVVKTGPGAKVRFIRKVIVPGGESGTSDVYMPNSEYTVEDAVVENGPSANEMAADLLNAVQATPSPVPETVAGTR